MRLACIAILVCLICSGCRVNPRAEREIALLRAEILDLEDQYYLIKSQRDAAVSRLHECGISYDPQGFPVNHGSSPIMESEPGRVYETAPGVFEQPALRIEDQNLPESPPSTSQRQVVPNDSSYATAAPAGGSPGNANAVSRIIVNRRLSGGQDLDGTAGDEGLSLMIQPLDDTGSVQKAAGDVSIRLVENRGGLQPRQLGSWEFTSAEIESFFVKDDYPDQGILLHLPWNDRLPENRRLTATVIFVAPNRKRLETTIEFDIVPPPRNYSLEDPLIAEWIESDERWRDAASPPTPPPATSSRQAESASDQSAPRISAPRWRPVR